jgi:hypothetical protein
VSVTFLVGVLGFTKLSEKSRVKLKISPMICMANKYNLKYMREFKNA